MVKRKSLKEIYGLEEDTSGFSSSLVLWYNKLIQKTYDDLDEKDVSIMVRQSILPELAMDKAIEILLKNPFSGDFWDGDLLCTIAKSMSSFDVARGNNHGKLLLIRRKSKEGISEFEWANEESKNDFSDSLKKLDYLLDNRAVSHRNP
ncbi:MAG: contact-dependent growth inhibition system immunity protein [Clostridia bacterium]|nr:contact-dependent growth inhibition system immunity protein [Clostridia bacterium]